MAWGGARPGAGRKRVSGAKPAPTSKPQLRAETKVNPPAATVPAVAKGIPQLFDPRIWGDTLRDIEEISRKYSTKQPRTTENNPFQLPKFPKLAVPSDEKLTMAMDNALTGNLGYAGEQWLAGPVLDALPGEGLLFLGYTYLSELAQRPEYRVMSETIADDATRRWIDFDVVGDEKKRKEDRAKDPGGYDERMADPDERKKRVDGAGKTDKVKALKDDQLRLQVKDRYYEQCRNDGFFGRSHLFHDIRIDDSNEMNPEDLKSPIGDSRDPTSISKVPLNSFKALRTIEPVWTYPLMYNAINPLREDWYNPQVWYVMGQEIHGSRLQTFVGHPVPDMLKPAYAFGGLSLTQMAKPYVDIWLQTRQSVAALIHSFSVMVLMTDINTLLQPGNAGNLLARVAAFNAFRDNMGTFVVNKNTEDFKNVSASLGGLHELQAQSQEHMAAVHRIPLVKFTGIQPAGLNASSEGEIEVYDDTIGAYQGRFMDANLRRTINFEQLSLWGAIDPEITHTWNKLRDMTLSEKGQKEKDDADRDQKYVDMGAIAPEEVRKIIINNPDLPYTGLDPDDVPEPPAEEGLLGPGAGGAATEHEKEADGTGGEPDKGGGANDAEVPFAADNHWARDPATGEPVVLIGDEFKESDHPRGQPDNAGQFGPGGGAAAPKRQYGGLYKQTGNGTKADHAATVEHVLKNPPRAGSSYRELLTRLVKDAPELGGDVEKLKSHLGQAYMNAREQLLAKALAAGSDAESKKFAAMADKAKEKAQALGWKPEAVILPPASGWTSDNNASPALSGYRAKAQKDLVAQGIETGLENLSAFDLAKNKPIDLGPPANQQARFVGFSPEMVKAFENPANSLEMHHNHPSDTSFSAQDIDVLAHYPGIARVYAHGHAGSSYAVEGARKALVGFYGRIMRHAEHQGSGTGVYAAIGALPIRAADKGRLLQHALLSGMDRAGLISGYKASLAPDLKALVEGTPDFDKWVGKVATRAKVEADQIIRSRA